MMFGFGENEEKETERNQLLRNIAKKFCPGSFVELNRLKGLNVDVPVKDGPIAVVKAGGIETLFFGIIDEVTKELWVFSTHVDSNGVVDATERTITGNGGVKFGNGKLHFPEDEYASSDHFDVSHGPDAEVMRVHDETSVNGTTVTLHKPVEDAK
ncbi:hypothetical protein KBC31_02540 [Candidatus Saccharibacteria bacterium]|nr:hypothetical protein [Candidatus Saccharibacteria bacterium]